MKKTINLKKVMAAILLVIGMMFSQGQHTEAADYYLGTYPKWGAEAYLMTETVDLLDYRNESDGLMTYWTETVKAVKGSSVTYLTYNLQIKYLRNSSDAHVTYQMSNGSSGSFWTSNTPEKNRISRMLAIYNATVMLAAVRNV